MKMKFSSWGMPSPGAVMATNISNCFFSRGTKVALSSCFFSTEEERLSVERLCEELKQKLEATEAEQQSLYLKMTAEVDDLNITKANLEERLIELIKYDSFNYIREKDRPFRGCKSCRSRRIFRKCGACPATRWSPVLSTEGTRWSIKGWSWHLEQGSEGV